MLALPAGAQDHRPIVNVQQYDNLGGLFVDFDE
jgi:hypothetical protein